MIRGSAGNIVGVGLNNATTGAAFTGAPVTVYVCIDGGAQTIGSVGSGLCTDEGNGYFTYRPSASETDGILLAFTFVATGAIPQTLQVFTDDDVPSPTPAITGAGGAALTTPSAIIIAALRRLRVLQAGMLPSAEDLADGFARLNSMIRSWALQRGTMQRIVRTTWTIVASQAGYTVGPGGNLDIARPASPQAMDGIGFQDTSVTPTFEYPSQRPLTEDQYAGNPLKTWTATYPMRWYYAPTTPLGTLYPLPIPTSATLQGVVYAPTAVAAFSGVTDTIALADGYDLAIQENLAVLLAPEWGVEANPALLQSARDSKAWVTTSNVRMADLDTTGVAAVFGGRGRRSNIYSGEV